MMPVTALVLQAGAGGGPLMLLPIVAIIGMFIFMTWQQGRQRKAWAEKLKELKPGDRVVTSGGLTGAVMSVKDEAVVLRVPPDNIKLEVARSSIVTLTTSEDTKS